MPSPKSRRSLTRHFEGAPISPQNLSQWRLGGHQDWLLRRLFADQTLAISELGLELEPESGRRLADHAATALAARFGILLAHWNGEIDDKIEATGKFLTRLCPSVVRLQRAAHQAALDRFEEQRQREDEKSRQTERIRSKFTTQLAAQEYGNYMAAQCGGDERARRYGEAVMEVALTDFDDPLESLRRYREDQAAAAGKPKTETPDNPLPPKESETAAPPASPQAAAKSITVNQSNFSPSNPPPPDPDVLEFERAAKLAEMGSPLGAYQLGARYRDGLGCAKDLEKAKFWLERAAAKGIGPAKLELNSLRGR